MKIISSSGVVAEGDDTLDALKVCYRWAEADGYFFHSARSGLLTGIAANGALWALTWLHPTKLAVLDFLRIKAVITTPFTTAQEWALGAFHVTSLPGGYSSNTTAYSVFNTPFKKRTSYPSSGVIISVATTAGMTGQTPLFDQSEFMSDTAWEMAAAATVPHSCIHMEKDYTTGADSPLIIAANEGIVVRNLILMGAAGVMRVAVDVAWHEADPSEI